MLSKEVREFAQVPDRFTRLSPDVERYADERVCIIQGPVWAGVSGVRVGEEDVEALYAEVHERVPPHKSLAWWIDPDARPADLRERLIALGATVPPTGHTLHAMACVEEPAVGNTGVEVTRVETFDDHLAAVGIMWDAFDVPQEQREAQRPHLRTEHEAGVEAGGVMTFLARVDGKPAGVGRSIYSDRGVFLIAGSVAEWARGRGIYRALVRARWDDAVARGTPALVTEAMPDTSYPILKRLGFEEVCVIHRLREGA